MTFLETEDAARAYVADRCAKRDFGRLTRFASLLLAANTQQNLVAPSSVQSMWLRHIADSAQLADLASDEIDPWIDLGSGAGFPGLVLAIMNPSRRFKLIEVRNLRVQWLRAAVSDLAIDNCEIIGTDVRKVTGFQCGVISARAFAPLDRLIALSARFSTATTRWVLPKGRGAAQEVSALPSRLRAMFHVKQSVTDRSAGIVIATGRVELNA